MISKIIQDRDKSRVVVEPGVVVVKPKELLGSRGRAKAVEGMVSMGQHKQEKAPRLQHAVPLKKSSHRVQEVL